MKSADLVMVATDMDKFPYSLIVKPAIKRAEDLVGVLAPTFGTAGTIGTLALCGSIAYQHTRGLDS